MTGHTSGPWVVEPILDRFNVYIAGAACVCIARDCTAADASLIAAAPELLYQLQAAREFIECDRVNLADCHMDPVTNELDDDGKVGVAEYDVMLASIDAAIAKAEAT